MKRSDSERRVTDEKVCVPCGQSLSGMSSSVSLHVFRKRVEGGRTGPVGRGVYPVRPPGGGLLVRSGQREDADEVRDVSYHEDHCEEAGGLGESTDDPVLGVAECSVHEGEDHCHPCNGRHVRDDSAHSVPGINH